MSTVTHPALAVLHGPRVALATVGGWLRGAMRAIMVARMTQVLYAMSDGQLAQIGLTRADIPDEARKTMGLSL